MSSAIQHAPDADRLRANTRPDVNERLDQNTELRIREAASRSKDGVTDRIIDLGREWNFDRVIEVEASMTGLTGLVLGAFLDTRFLLMPGMAASMLRCIRYRAGIHCCRCCAGLGSGARKRLIASTTR